MFATVKTATLFGVDARPIDVEVELTQGLPMFSIIGLGDRAVQEARYRIESAMRASRLELPRKRATINLAPAALKKDGAALDLPMALGLLAASGSLDATELEQTIAIGELALDGKLRAVRGALAVTSFAKRAGMRRIIVPYENGSEAKVLDGIEVVAAPSLEALVAYLRGGPELPPPKRRTKRKRSKRGQLDLADVRGQSHARRALEIAAAGEHNLLMVGPPGSGKTMLARRMPSIMPPMSPAEQIEVTKIWSAAGMLKGRDLIEERPFRAPHHTLSVQALVGGGPIVRPGEISLAHLGVLFLDEIAELPRRTLESLRQPLEDRTVTISRAKESVELPARFILVGAANPCPCGWFGDESGRCNCTAEAIRRYALRLSGPFLDRVDLIVEVPALPAKAILKAPPSESSQSIAPRVAEARQTALTLRGRPNGRLAGKELRESRTFEKNSLSLIATAIEKFGLSARVVDRMLRVAHTIADLERSEEVKEHHIAEALSFRRVVSLASLAA